MTADTTTAPERIWAWDYDFWSGEGWQNGNNTWCDENPHPIRATEYIRADLCRAPVAQDAEPVAWQGRSGMIVHEPINGFRPLYAHHAPQPSDEAATLRAQLAEARAALKAAEAHADRLADALQHMVNAALHPDQMADEALAAYHAWRAGE